MDPWPDFNPRMAALNYAGRVEATAVDPAVGAAVNALVCGLVYIGDQVRALVEQAGARAAVGESDQ